MAHERIDPIAFRNRLRAVWNVKPGSYSARAVVSVLGAMRDSMAAMRGRIGVGVWPTDRSSESRALRGWDREFRAFSDRLHVYTDEIPPCWGQSADCWTGDVDGQTEIEHLQKWVTGPILEGSHPVGIDPALGLNWARHPEAIVAASLWNQLVELEQLRDEQRSLSSHVGEWLLVVQRELSRSAPGEPKTIRDQVEDALNNVKNAAQDTWTGVKALAGVVIVGTTGVLALRWRKKSQRKVRSVEEP